MTTGIRNNLRKQTEVEAKGGARPSPSAVKTKRGPGVVVHTSYPSTRGPEEVGSQLPGQPSLKLTDPPALPGAVWGKRYAPWHRACEAFIYKVLTTLLNTQSDSILGDSDVHTERSVPGRSAVDGTSAGL